MVYTIDPLRDPRWTELVIRHDAASVFHSRPWLEALWRTYGYKPVVYTTSPPSSVLSNGIVLSEIKSWLTGWRMVSVSFSDHCEPLLDNAASGEAIIAALRNTVGSDKWKYVELRPTSERAAVDGAVTFPCYFLHRLDLRPSTNDLLHQAHKTAVQQPIRRAEREGLTYERGNSERLLNTFYRLMLQTRRRHQLPPQPIQWFRNVMSSMGERAQIRVAFKGGNGIASILTLQHKDEIVYKYGCSDAAFQNLGGTALLLWKTIIEAKAAGLTSMDFGRSDSDNTGLIDFKERWGAKPSRLTYLRWYRNAESAAAIRRSPAFAKHIFALVPDPVLQATGRILYRHAG
jgi:hypothetical protein